MKVARNGIDAASSRDLTGAVAGSYLERDDALPLQRAYRWEKERANHVFLTQPANGQARDWTWAQAMDESRRVAAFLSAQQWEPGSRIVILSKNCAWWMMAELAVWMSGHVSVPLYAALTAQSIRSLMEHCDAVACFLGGVDDQSVLTEGIPNGVKRIAFPNVSDPLAHAWDSIVRDTPRLGPSPVRSADEIATIMYTSGTTGVAKGAIHRFRAFIYFAASITRVIGDSPSERMLSYLPLAHIAERALLEGGALYCGFHLYFVESVDTFLVDLKRSRATVFFSVPRLYIRFQQKVLTKVPQQKLDRLLRIPLVRTIVQRRILRELGLNHARLAASGGAALPLSTLLWFRQIGLNLVEGYGMTETGITHTPKAGASRPGTVGDAVPSVEVKMSESGEVLIRSRMNMVGYYKAPELTAATFTEDGFFRTGDLGEVDAEGWLKIIGRVKEQFKTTKGKYVSPNAIEKLLCVHPAVEGCCVMGESMTHPFAVVVPTEEWRAALSRGEGKEALAASLGQMLSEVNAQLQTYERLKFIVVTDQPWTVRNGLLTPTMKLKRNVLERTFSTWFDTWSREGAPVVWHLMTPEQRVGQQAGS